jgi:hypothetical protein
MHFFQQTFSFPQGPDERMKFVFKNLVRFNSKYFLQRINSDDLSAQINHLHDFVRETSVTTEEWMYVFSFLRHSVRQELHTGPPWNSSLRQARSAQTSAKATLYSARTPRIFGLTLLLSLLPPYRIHPPLRHAGCLEPGRVYQQRQAPRRDRGHRPGSLLHNRRLGLCVFYLVALLSLIYEVKNGESIASEGKGEYMWVEGKVIIIM